MNMISPKKHRERVEEIYARLRDEEVRDPYGGRRVNWLNFYKKFNKIIKKNPELTKIPLLLFGVSRRSYNGYLFDILADKFLLHYLRVKRLSTIFSRPIPNGITLEKMNENYEYVFVIFDKLAQDMLFPIIEKMMLTEKKILVITSGKEHHGMDERYREKLEFFIIDKEVIKLPKSILKRIFMRCGKQHDEMAKNVEDDTLKEFLKVNSAFLGLQIKLANLQYYLFSEIFSKTMPKVIISLNPTVAFEVAKGLGIKTIMFQHGLVGDRIPVVWPYVSDYIIIWGEIWRENFLKNTDGTVEIKSLGNPRFDSLVKTSGRSVENKTQKKKNVVYISAGGDYNEYTRVFFGAIEKIFGKLDDKINLIIKLHPREDIDSKKIFKKCINKEIFNKLIFIKEEPIDEVILESEVVILFSSTVILEAIALQKPVLRINFTGYPVLDYDDFSKFGLDDAIFNPQELLDNMEKCLNDDDNYRKIMIKKQNNFLNKYISNLGISADAVTKFITEISR